MLLSSVLCRGGPCASFQQHRHSGYRIWTHRNTETKDVHEVHSPGIERMCNNVPRCRLWRTWPRVTSRTDWPHASTVARTLSLVSAEFVVRFLVHYTDYLPGYSRSDLPSSATKRLIWTQYHESTFTQLSTAHSVGFGVHFYHKSSLWNRCRICVGNVSRRSFALPIALSPRKAPLPPHTRPAWAFVLPNNVRWLPTRVSSRYVPAWRTDTCKHQSALFIWLCTAALLIHCNLVQSFSWHVPYSVYTAKPSPVRWTSWETRLEIVAREQILLSASSITFLSIRCTCTLTGQNKNSCMLQYALLDWTAHEDYDLLHGGWPY